MMVFSGFVKVRETGSNETAMMKLINIYFILYPILLQTSIENFSD